MKKRIHMLDSSLKCAKDKEREARRKQLEMQNSSLHSPLGLFLNKGKYYQKLLQTSQKHVYNENKNSDLKGYCFIWFSSKQQVLPTSVWRFYALLIRCHEAISRLYNVHYLGVVNLERENKQMGCEGNDSLRAYLKQLDNCNIEN